MTLLRYFLDYWSPKQIAARLDSWTRGFREATGQAPDPAVEKRIAANRWASFTNEELEAMRGPLGLLVWEMHITDEIEAEITRRKDHP
jgi:hypothetical protein